MNDTTGGYRRQKFCMSKGMWQVRFFGLTLVTHMSKYMRRIIYGAVIIDYWVNTKKRIKSNKVEEIVWEATGRAVKQCDIINQNWISKFLPG